MLYRSPNSFGSRWFVQSIALCLLLGQAPVAAEVLHEGPGKGAALLAAPAPHQGGKSTGRVGASGQRRSPVSCRVSIPEVNESANGTAFHYPTMVQYLTNPICQQSAGRIAKGAIDLGISWMTNPPFRLDRYARASQKGDLKGRDRAEMALAKKIPNILQRDPIGSDKLLMLIGQLALLSPSAARAGMAELAVQQLDTGAALLDQVDPSQRAQVGQRISRVLMRLGLNQGPILQAFGDSVESRAALAQADSLAKIFRGLGAAARVNAALVPAFNVSAGALNRGVQKGEKLYKTSQRNGVMKAVYEAINVANLGNEQFEPALAELNEALFPMMSGYPLTATALRRAWDSVLAILSDGDTQTVLADAVGLSLTHEMIFLSTSDRVSLLLAARNYPQISVAIQSNHLGAYNRMRANWKSGSLSKKRFKMIRKKHLIPWAKDILELDIAHLTRNWLQEVVRARLIKDDSVERRFPLHVLAHLELREQASESGIDESNVPRTAQAFAQSFWSLWTLSSVHVPVLWDWVERYDAKQEAEKLADAQPVTNNLEGFDAFRPQEQAQSVKPIDDVEFALVE